MNNRDTKASLVWITNILRKHNIPFQITGGLAATAYGGTRNIEDIDIDIPENTFDILKNEVAEFIIFGPENFKSEKWDLLLMTLNYQGQDIDLGGAHQTKIFNASTKEWQALHEDFSKAKIMDVLGLQLPVIPYEQLIAYKTALSREVDLIDIEEIVNYKEKYQPTDKMHADEIEIDAHLVTRLLTEQFPQWASLPLKRFHSSGTDNAIYHLGDKMIVRLPRTNNAAERVDKEHHWLPKLAPFLPLAIPVPLAMGLPSKEYPLHWSIYPWLNGETATIEHIANPNQAAIKLAQFINALHQIDPTDGPLPGSHNFYRGVPLETRDHETREAIQALQGIVDTREVSVAWQAALDAPTWQDSLVWIHGDLLPGNLLLEHGQFSAVIDFGGMGVGDPACDLITAWCLFSADTRDIFRRELRVDDTTWARGRGWALSIGLIALPYYQFTNPVFAKIASHMINEVITDHKGGV